MANGASFCDRPLGVPVTTTVSVLFQDTAFAQEVSLAGGETREVFFRPEEWGALVVKNPRVWWPHPLGPQELYDIGFEDYLERNGVVIMEWSENVRGALPEDRLEITISGDGDTPRKTVKLPAAFSAAYPDAAFRVVHPDNLEDFLER